MKNWKNNPTGGVYVQWDNGDKNVYRYGAENCYDVIVYSLSSLYVLIIVLIQCCEMILFIQKV